MEVSKSTALIIDDDKDLCMMLAAIAEAQQYEVTEANSLNEGAAVMKQLRPDIIFLDHHLPDGLGIEFIPSIQKFDQNIKIIVITADPSGAMRQKVLGEANTYFLSKPFSIRSVNDVLHTIREVSLRPH
jgi:DNA-binding response OmpR family regulator